MRALKQVHQQLTADFANNKFFNFLQKDNVISLTPEKNHFRTLIWLHGLGDVSENFLAAFNNLDWEFCPITKETKVVLITAPIRALTKNNGEEMTCWYDILYSGWIDKYLKEGAKIGVNLDHVEESSKMIMKHMDEEIKILGDPKKLYVGGFSQGCNIALQAGLNYPFTIGGILAYSGMMLPTKNNEQSKKTPILISHGEQDEVILWKNAEQTYSQLKEHEGKVNVVIAEDTQHSMSLKGFKAMKEFIYQ